LLGTATLSQDGLQRVADPGASSELSAPSRLPLMVAAECMRFELSLDLDVGCGHDLLPYGGVLTDERRELLRRVVIAKLNDVIVRMMGSPEVVGSFTRQGLEVFSSTPAQFTEKFAPKCRAGRR
jgi:hypothetical protein